MGKQIKITEEEYEEVKAAIKKNKNKNKRIDKKLQIMALRYEGMKCSEIGDKLGYSKYRVSHLCREFKQSGINEYIRQKYPGNHRSLRIEEEGELLAKFKKKANEGKIVIVQEIKAASDEKIGKDTGRGYIYMVLKRKGWRKVMPRSKHPQKASYETIDASKKLKHE